MNKSLLTTLTLIYFIFNVNSFAQTPWERPEGIDESIFLENKIWIQDNYEAAPDQVLNQLYWFLTNAPSSHKNLYIYATDVYHSMFDLKIEEEDYDGAWMYADSAMMMYDKRMDIFGERQKVIPFKAYYAFYYWTEFPEKAQELYDLYEEDIEIEGEDTPHFMVEDYMRLVGLKRNATKPEAAEATEELQEMYEYLKEPALTDDDVVMIYEKLNRIIAANIHNATPDEDWGATRDYVDEVFQTSVTIDCDYVKRFFGEKFQADPTNAELAEELVAQMLSVGCEISKEPLFEEALTFLNEQEKTYSRVIALALLKKAKGDEAGYLSYIEESIALASSPQDKADAYMILAKNSDWSQGRTYALKAAEFGAASRAYTFIGNLYYNSGSACGGDNPVQQRACYLAAYDMYAKAGNQRGMSKAQAQFPSSEEVFTQGMSVNNSINVGCWIGGSTTIRTRD